MRHLFHTVIILHAYTSCGNIVYITRTMSFILNNCFRLVHHFFLLFLFVRAMANTLLCEERARHDEAASQGARRGRERNRKGGGQEETEGWQENRQRQRERDENIEGRHTKPFKNHNA